jgi:DivIVA domain-containing protein
MIRSSFVEGHHFLIARRRGYDMNEVDAVMKRLADTLRRYEQRGTDAGPDDSVTDLERARQARAYAEDLVAQSDEIQQQSVTELNRARQQAAEIVAGAREEADQIRQTALSESAIMVRKRNDRSEALITAALSEVKALRGRALREINDYNGSKRAEADALIQTARFSSEELLEDARHEAGSILGRARREHTELERRLAQLRTAISGIEEQFRSLSESTLKQTEIMASMISLETNNLEEVVDEKEPEVVRLTQQPARTIDLTDREEPATGTSDAERYAVQPGQTIYERRGGGIRSRMEHGEDEPES